MPVGVNCTWNDSGPVKYAFPFMPQPGRPVFHAMPAFMAPSGPIFPFMVAPTGWFHSVVLNASSTSEPSMVPSAAIDTVPLP